MSMYLNIPVFAYRADLGESIRRSLQYQPEEVSLGFGTEPAFPVQEHTRERFDATVLLQGPDALSAVESFFDHCQGRLRPFWLTTALEDLEAAPGSDSSSVLVHSAAGLEDWSLHPGGHIQLQSPGGTIYHRKIADITDGPEPGYFRLTLDAVLPEAPDNRWQIMRLLLVRLSGDEIAFSFEADNVARLRFLVIELPAEYSAGADQWQPVYLYRITRRYNIGLIYSMHLTSHPVPIEAGGVTWHPIPIDHGGLSVSTEGDTDRLSVDMLAFPGNPFDEWLPLNIGQPTGLVLGMISLDESTGEVSDPLAILFRGIVESVTREGFLLKLRVVSPLAFGDKRVPRFFLQTRCNYQLYDRSTCRVSAQAYRLEGSIAAIDPENGTVDVEMSGLVGKDEDWLPGGHIEIGAPPSVEIRTIRKVEVITATRHRLFLNASLRVSQVNDACYAWPGCDRTPQHCAQRFDNFLNYGGHPFIPFENPTLKAMPLVSPAASGGKK